MPAAGLCWLIWLGLGLKFLQNQPSGFLRLSQARESPLNEAQWPLLSPKAPLRTQVPPEPGLPVTSGLGPAPEPLAPQGPDLLPIQFVQLGEGG